MTRMAVTRNANASRARPVRKSRGGGIPFSDSVCSTVCSNGRDAAPPRGPRGQRERRKIKVSAVTAHGGLFTLYTSFYIRVSIYEILPYTPPDRARA